MKQHTSINLLPGLAAALLFAACSNHYKAEEGKEQDSTIAVKTEVVTSRPQAGEISFSGNIEGETTVKLGFMVPGKVSQIAPKTGQFVAKGQLIASLDPVNYDLNKQLADVQLHEATDEYDRLKLLHARGSLSESDFSKTGFSLQKAQVQQKLEAKNLSDTKLFAPISGVLLDKQTQEGEIISAGAPLFTVSDIRKVKVVAFVPESEIKGLHIGQPANISVAALDKIFRGKIAEVGAVADAASRAFTIKILVDNAGFQIRPGMIAEAKISLSTEKTSIQLPPESIISDPGNQTSVYVVDPSSQKAFKRKVSLGRMFANKIEIISGLSVGEQVITSGQTKVSDGSVITIEK